MRPKLENFGPLCQSACAMQLAVLKWPCDTNTKASLGKCPHKKGGWCQKQKSEQGIANWLWGAKRSSFIVPQPRNLGHLILIQNPKFTKA